MHGHTLINKRILSSCRFVANRVRLQLFASAYNLGTFLRRLALPQAVQQWSLTMLREKLIKIGARIVRGARYVMFQRAEVAIPRTLFRTTWPRIARLKIKNELREPKMTPGYAMTLHLWISSGQRAAGVVRTDFIWEMSE
jgi:hypothetical protein